MSDQDQTPEPTNTTEDTTTQENTTTQEEPPTENNNNTTTTEEDQKPTEEDPNVENNNTNTTDDEKKTEDPPKEEDQPPKEEDSPANDQPNNTTTTEEERDPTPPPPKDERASSRASSRVKTPPITNTKKNQPANNLSSNRNRSPSNRYPPITTVSYPGRQNNLSVADFLDPSKPLVKSTQPLTHPRGPTFVEPDTAEMRKQERLEHKEQNGKLSESIQSQRVNERKYLKAQYEFEREKKLAEKTIYHRERVAQWSSRLAASPLGVDLVADNERIEEHAFIRQREEKRKKQLAEKRKRKIKNEIIVKALAEVPLLEEARRQKREMLEEERRQKAIRDVQRVEAIQERKLRDLESMASQRQSRLDQRLMEH